MKILSVFYKGNEIALYNNLIGKKSVYYNGHLMASKWTFYGGKLTFDVRENGESVTYTASFGTSNYRSNYYTGDVWRNYEPLVITSGNGRSTPRLNAPKRPLEHYESEFV